MMTAAAEEAVLAAAEATRTAATTDRVIYRIIWRTCEARIFSVGGIVFIGL